MVKKLVTSFGPLFLLIMIAAIALPAMASEGTQTIEPPPARPLYNPSGIHSAADPSLASRTQSEKTIPPPVGFLSAQSSVAFNRLDGSTLNIYRYDTLSGNTYMLTYGPYDSISPRINPSLDRIAFHAARNEPSLQIYTMNMDGSNVTRVGNIEADSINPYWSPDGTHIAFASTLNNGVGDIFTMDASGNGITRLTNNAVYDDMPSWSPDGTRIAYISYTNNVYRVWVMNSDGSAAHQLSQEAYSASPVWSPDGSLIAYDADGDNDGWMELWVMNADGTNRHQIYKPAFANTDAYMGSWNPGGSSLAFTQVEWIYYYGNWYWTKAYVSSVSVIPGGACFSPIGDVNWYPDWGSTDHLAPVTSMPALPTEVPYQFTVAWSGTDPGDSGISEYNVQVKASSGGVWTDWLPLTVSTSAVYTGEGGVTYYFRTRAFDKVGNVGLLPDTYQAYTRVESLAPETSITELPEFARGSVIVRWGGVDFGGSGILDYDIQYNDATQGSSWVAWLTGTSDTSHEFSGSPGHTYYFRSRATDKAGNVEAWPPGNGDRQVSFYDWLVDGSATDILGAPLMGVEAAIASGEVGRLPSNFDGDYTSYGVTAPDELVSWSKPGYTALPQTRLNGTTDRGFDIFLPPNPNAVLNPGFEPDLTSWQSTGSVIADTLPHTGDASARLGAPFSFGESLQFEDYTGWTHIGALLADESGGVHALWKKDNLVYYRYRSPAGIWSNSELVAASSSPFDDATTNLVVTPDGIAYAFWTSDYVIYYSYRTGEGSWSSPMAVSDINQNSEYHIAASDDEGGLHITWQCQVGLYNEVCYRHKSSGASWDPIVQITENSIDYLTGPSLMIVQDGTVHLQWGDGEHAFYSQRDIAGVWSEAEMICPSCVDTMGTMIAVDPAGSPQATWQIEVWEGGNYHDEVYFAERLPDGTWTNPVLVNNNGMLPQIAIDQQGRTHVAYNDSTYNGVYHSYRELDGLWHHSNPILTGQWACTFDLFVDQQGAVHLVFPNGYTHWMGGPQWTPIVTYGGSDQQVDVHAVVDTFGGVHVLWSEALVSSSNLVYVSPHVVNTPGVSTLSQSLQVGDASTNPVLSFLASSGGANLSGGTTFSVTLTSSISSTLLYASTGWNEGWKHHTVDMSDWAGQAVTLTYSLSQPVGYPDSWAYVDEVAVGAVYPDPWVSLEGGARTALPGDQFTYQLLYGNHGVVQSPGTTITLTLPVGLSFVDASENPSIVGNQLIWDVGTLAPGSAPLPIDVTVEVDANAPLGSTVVTTVNISTTSSELENLNNADQSETYLIAHTYLPILRR